MLTKVSQDDLLWIARHHGGATCSERLKCLATKTALKSASEEKAIQAILDAAKRLEGFEAQHGGRYAILVSIREIEQ